MTGKARYCSLCSFQQEEIQDAWVHNDGTHTGFYRKAYLCSHCGHIDYFIEKARILNPSKRNSP